MHGKDEEGMIILEFTIQVLVFLSRNQGYKMKLQRGRLKRAQIFISALYNETGELCHNVLQRPMLTLQKSNQLHR